ncbi:TPA: phosphotransferase, partial [Streptococcus pneumoniae]
MNLNKEVRWKDKQYIAFDFFDTTIHRNCHPEVILFEWSKKISIYFSFKISATEIYSIRKKSEIHEKQEKQLEEIKYERLLQLVFYTILSRLKSDVTDYNLEDFLIYARTCEEEIELRHISIDTDTINFIEFLKQNGKKIILISDFYSDKKLI